MTQACKRPLAALLAPIQNGLSLFYIAAFFGRSVTNKDLQGALRTKCFFRVSVTTTRMVCRQPYSRVLTTRSRWWCGSVSTGGTPIPLSRKTSRHARQT
jgi:hypothetical protein